MRLGPLFAIGLIAAPLMGADAQEATRPGARVLLHGDGAILQGLDKVTATVTTFTAPLDTMVRFGTLDITVRDCRKAPPTEPPEKIAFLEIDETNPNTEAARVYSGWMFASSPALAALEHPVYDIWVIDCMNVSTAPEDNSEGN
ncbi:MAG: DUF2155 domain-containing protein [Alphaproteobacteria bacterium]|nr:DUF2155 domain-containing protein [Alphaproteobacteria bacterium]MCZ6763887.1 DUF2155 domain-containing protein [Alphaproteobacteria bacterium]